MERQFLKVDRQGAVVRVTIDQPAKRNALSLSVVDQLVDLALELEGEAEVRAIVLTGSGEKVFASGADLDELPEALATPANAREYDAKVGRLYEAIASSRLPWIARIGGHAIGGGCLLALACDVRVAASHVKLGFPAGRIGLMLSPAEHRLILDAMRASQAKWLIFSGRRIDAAQGLAWGLVDQVVASDELDRTVAALAAEMAAGAPLALTAAKSLLNAMGPQTDPTLTESVISRVYQSIYNSTDLVEGLDAIRDKREPQFLGR